MISCTPFVGSSAWRLPKPAMPHISGSTTPCTKAQAMAASTALPPVRSTRAPASTASGCGATIMLLAMGGFLARWRDARPLACQAGNEEGEHREEDQQGEDDDLCRDEPA